MIKKDYITFILGIIFIIILLLFLLYNLVKNSSSYYSLESFSNQNLPNGNIIKEGSFQDKQHINNSNVGPGNEIINYPNPGLSSYVLSQSSLLDNGNKSEVSYIIRLFLNNKKIYKFCCWVFLTNEWNGNNYIFNFKVFNNNQNIMKKNEGVLVETKKIYNTLWSKYEYIFDFSPNDTGELNWYLGFQPNNTSGYRYITGVEVSQFNPLLTNFNLTNGLQLFVNTYKEESYNKSNLVWKDLSSMGNDCLLSQLTSQTNNDFIETKNINIKCSNLNTLNIKPNQNFSICWMAKYNPIKEKINNQSYIFEIFSIYTQNNDIPYIKIDIDLFENSFIISIGSIKHKPINIGLCQSQSLYTLIKNGNRFFIRKDDIQLNQEDLFIYTNFRNCIFSTYKPLIFYPNKDVYSKLYSILIYNYAISYIEIEVIRLYLLELKKKEKSNKTSKNDCKIIKRKNDCKTCNNEYLDPIEQQPDFYNNSNELDESLKESDNKFINDLLNEFNISNNEISFKQDNYERTPYENNYYNDNIQYYNDNIQYYNDKKDSNNKKYSNYKKDSNDKKYSNYKNKVVKKNKNCDEIEHFTSNNIRKLNIMHKNNIKKKIVSNSNLNKIEQFTSNGMPKSEEDEDENENEEEQKLEELIEEIIEEENKQKNDSNVNNNLNEEEYMNITDELYNQEQMEEMREEQIETEQETKIETETKNEREQKEEEYSLLTQNFSKNIDESYNLSNETLVEETTEELNKTLDKNTRESLKLKIKLLKNILEEEEKKTKQEPQSRTNKLIDTQGNIIENAKYDPNDIIEIKNSNSNFINNNNNNNNNNNINNNNINNNNINNINNNNNNNNDNNDTSFNRVPINVDKNTNLCKINEDDYIKKSDLELKYMPINTVNKYYIKKDNIPCWGCNLK